MNPSATGQGKIRSHRRNIRIVPTQATWIIVQVTENGTEYLYEWFERSSESFSKDLGQLSPIFSCMIDY